MKGDDAIPRGGHGLLSKPRRREGSLQVLQRSDPRLCYAAPPFWDRSRLAALPSGDTHRDHAPTARCSDPHSDTRIALSRPVFERQSAQRGRREVAPPGTLRRFRSIHSRDRRHSNRAHLPSRRVCSTTGWTRRNTRDPGCSSPRGCGRHTHHHQSHAHPAGRLGDDRVHDRCCCFEIPRHDRRCHCRHSHHERWRILHSRVQ